MVVNQSSWKDKFKNPVSNPSGVSIPTNLLMLHMLGMVFMCYMDVNSNWVLPLAVTWVLHLRFLQWRDDKYRNLSVATCSLACFVHYSRINFAMSLLCLATDQEKAPYVIRKTVRDVAEWLDVNYLPLINPVMGTNSQEWVATIREWMEINLDVSFTIFSVETTRLRDLGVNEVPIDISDRPSLSAGAEINRIIDLATKYRPAFVILTGILSCHMLGPFGVLIFALHVATYLLTNRKEPRQIMDGTKYVMKDGTYRIQIKLFGLDLSSGIGVASNGVLHVPYHVCRALPLDVGKSRVKPMYTAQADDLVTYGGYPQFSAPKRGEKLYINAERDDGRTTYLAEPDIDEASRMFCWPSPTQPGESGSPVMVMRDEKPVLVGLAGRWVKNSALDQTEYSVLYKRPDVTDDYYQAFITAPGSGKTRYRIPEQVNKALIERKGRVLVTGPTRVVCMEIADALEQNGVVCGLNISGMKGSSKPGAPVQIAAHHTMLQLLTGSSPLVNGAKTLIIDEAHFNDAATIMLRSYGRHLSQQGVTLIEMSATLDGRVSDQSNYTIDDREMKESDYLNVVRTHLENEQRILVFVPSMRSAEAVMLGKKFASYKIIKLSRDTFKEAIVEVKDVERKLILSTDIAECGINIPDLDVVIDFRKKFDYYYDAGVYSQATLGCSEASTIQRRGRVGRTKPGIYYYVERRPHNSLSSAEMDAAICMTGRHWSPGSENPLGLILTEKQFQLVLREGRPPTEVYLKCDGNGINRNQDMLRDSLKDWKNGSTHYVGCGRCKQCETDCKWYDERLHDWLVKGEEIKRTLAI